MFNVAHFIKTAAVDQNMEKLLKLRKELNERVKNDTKAINDFINLIGTVKDIITKHGFTVGDSEMELRYGLYRIDFRPHDEKQYNSLTYDQKNKLTDTIEGLLPKNVSLNYNKPFPWDITISSDALEIAIKRNFDLNY